MMMVERVARALCVARGWNPDDYHTPEDYASGDALADHAFPLWWQIRKEARAAIEAMREPTEGMQDAGAAVDADLEWLESAKAVPQVYRAMITAALSEGEG